MNSTQHVLISLEERHANNILAGTKSVELRRRTMHVEPGTVVWFYVKKPVGAVVGSAVVGETYSASPNTVWRKFGSVSGISRSEYLSYFENSAAASAMGVSDPRRLHTPISLETLRSVVAGFHPPQFYCRLTTESALLALFAARQNNTEKLLAASSFSNSPRLKQKGNILRTKELNAVLEA